jgi:anaerobic magnesium-protoporphyrin IX monomethyl ester cyclase
MSKILLIKPRFLIYLEFWDITHPMGLMYISSTLKIAGHEPRIHDCCLDHKDLHILKRTITEWKPDFIGISIIITELEHTKKIMKVIRDILPDVPVIFGGPWPSANPQEAIKTFGANFVVLGEGELVFP